jgi:ribosome maturation factor RimP
LSAFAEYGARVKKIIDQITQLIEPILDELGYELVDVSYLSKHGKWVLGLFIDKEGGVTIGDCVTVSREIGDFIDVKDVIEHEYVLEVSSPGLNRPLKKETDFIHVTGEKVKVRMSTPVEGRKNFIGRLISFERGMIQLDVEGKRFALPWKDVEKANRIYEFD